jgi:hypothetical protein
MNPSYMIQLMAAEHVRDQRAVAAARRGEPGRATRSNCRIGGWVRRARG